jgi:predicted RNase H-like HicB family nuclease
LYVYPYLIKEVRMGYDVYITRKERFYVAEVPALPGCRTLGRTEREVLENIRTLIDRHLRDLRRRQQIPQRVKVVRLYAGRPVSVPA